MKAEFLPLPLLCFSFPPGLLSETLPPPQQKGQVRVVPESSPPRLTL